MLMYNVQYCKYASYYAFWKCKTYSFLDKNTFKENTFKNLFKWWDNLRLPITIIRN